MLIVLNVYRITRVFFTRYSIETGQLIML